MRASDGFQLDPRGGLFPRKRACTSFTGYLSFPLLLLLISGFGSDAALNALLHTHRVILAAAGAAALFTILEQRPTPP